MCFKVQSVIFMSTTILFPVMGVHRFPLPPKLKLSLNSFHNHKQTKTPSTCLRTQISPKPCEMLKCRLGHPIESTYTLLLICFYVVKHLMLILALFDNIVCLWKNPVLLFFLHWNAGHWHPIQFKTFQLFTNQEILWWEQFMVK